MCLRRERIIGVLGTFAKSSSKLCFCTTTSTFVSVVGFAVSVDWAFVSSMGWGVVLIGIRRGDKRAVQVPFE